MRRDTVPGLLGAPLRPRGRWSPGFAGRPLDHDASAGPQVESVESDFDAIDLDGLLREIAGGLRGPRDEEDQ